MGRRLCAEHGRGHFVLHDVLAGAASGDRHRARGVAFRARGSAGRDRGAAVGADRARGRHRRARTDSERERARAGLGGRNHRHGRARGGCDQVFAELQSALDRIWHVPEKDKPSGIWVVLRARLLSFGLILGLAFLLMVSLVVSAGLAALGTWAGGLLPGWELVLQGLNVFVSLSIATVLFAMIFKFMPTARIAWRDVWIGAAVTAILFEVGKLLIALYLGKSGVTESFAAAGSLVLLLAWVYYAAQIFLLGAEFTKVYANEHGSVAGAKALAATEVTAAAAAADTDGVSHSAVPSDEALTPPPDSSCLARSAEAQTEVERRISRATHNLIRQLVLLGVIVVSKALVTRWCRRQRKPAHRRPVTH